MTGSDDKIRPYCKRLSVNSKRLCCACHFWMDYNKGRCELLWSTKKVMLYMNPTTPTLEMGNDFLLSKLCRDSRVSISNHLWLRCFEGRNEAASDELPLPWTEPCSRSFGKNWSIARKYASFYQIWRRKLAQYGLPHSMKAEVVTGLTYSNLLTLRS